MADAGSAQIVIELYEFVSFQVLLDCGVENVSGSSIWFEETDALFLSFFDRAWEASWKIFIEFWNFFKVHFAFGVQIVEQHLHFW